MSDASHRQRRRGMSLLELLAAMTAASVVTATAAGLVHRSFAFESRSRQVLGDEQTALRLARQFRADVHAARAVQPEPAAAAGHVLVVLDGPAGRITYRPTGTGLERVVGPADGAVARENYRFSRPVRWMADRNAGLVSLRGRAEGEATRLPRLVIDVTAAVSRPASATMPGATP
jgi:prepilin-type N-terminal cleavage/methylation domain-containing protein